MCFFGTSGASKPPPIPAPQVAAAPPPPENVAEAPAMNEGNKRKTDNQRKGTSALRINLSLGGTNAGGGGSGLSIPR